MMVTRVGPREPLDVGRRTVSMSLRSSCSGGGRRDNHSERGCPRGLLAVESARSRRGLGFPMAERCVTQGGRTAAMNFLVPDASENPTQLDLADIGLYPTPLQELRRLTRHVGGARIWVKRDDMTGLAFGGSKTRALAALLGHASSEGADTVITCGPNTSNHVRLTAAAANRLGLRCVLVLRGKGADSASQGNMLLNQMLGARLVFADVADLASLESVMDDMAQQLSATGAKPCIIPGGGYSPIGALGYRSLVRELIDQSAEKGFGIDAVIFASGSGCIQGGLLAGSRIENASIPIVGLSINRSVDELHSRIVHEAEAALCLQGRAQKVNAEDVIVLDEYLGQGYAAASPEGMAAITLAACTEGLLLDPCYTGKAMAGTIDLARRRYRRDQNIIFIHTGGTPGIFSYARELTIAAPTRWCFEQY